MGHRCGRPQSREHPCDSIHVGTTRLGVRQSALLGQTLEWGRSVRACTRGVKCHVGVLVLSMQALAAMGRRNYATWH